MSFYFIHAVDNPPAKLTNLIWKIDQKMNFRLREHIQASSSTCELLVDTCTVYSGELGYTKIAVSINKVNTAYYDSFSSPLSSE